MFRDATYLFLLITMIGLVTWMGWLTWKHRRSKSGG